MLYNAWLPLLSATHKDVCNARPNEKGKTLERIMSSLSGKGYFWAYCGHICAMAIVIPLLLSLSGGYGAATAIAAMGVWWFVFSIYTFRHLKTRPGPPLPGKQAC